MQSLHENVIIYLTFAKRLGAFLNIAFQSQATNLRHWDQILKINPMAFSPGVIGTH